MLTDPMLARNLRVALFEEESAAELEAVLEEWFDERSEETVVGISFEHHPDVASYMAHVLYTE